MEEDHSNDDVEIYFVARRDQEENDTDEESKHQFVIQLSFACL